MSTPMRSLLILAAGALILVALLGCLYATFGGIGIYMVMSGRALPGEPMFLDELTPSLADSVVQAGIGVVLIAGALTGRAYIRRLLARAERQGSR